MHWGSSPLACLFSPQPLVCVDLCPPLPTTAPCWWVSGCAISGHLTANNLIKECVMCKGWIVFHLSVYSLLNSFKNFGLHSSHHTFVCMFATTGTLFSIGGYVWGSLLWSIVSSASSEYLLLYVHLKGALFFLFYYSFFYH